MWVSVTCYGSGIVILYLVRKYFGVVVVLAVLMGVFPLMFGASLRESRKRSSRRRYELRGPNQCVAARGQSTSAIRSCLKNASMS